MGVLYLRLLGVLTEYEQGSTFYNIAYVMLEHFNELDKMSIADVAKLCTCSKSTISKFVRILHFEDYADFKSEANFKENRFQNTQNYNTNIQGYLEEHDVTDYIHCINQDLLSVMDIDLDIVKDIVKEIRNAKNVAAFGTLFSEIGALDLQYKMVYHNKFIITYESDTKQDEYLMNNQDEGVVIIYSTTGNYMRNYQLSSFKEEKKYSYHNKKVILITSNEKMKEDPRVDICLVYTLTSNLYTHSYIYPLINDLIIKEYRKVVNEEQT